jgi:hypothetical protein
MSAKVLLEYTLFAEMFCALAVLALLWRKRLIGKFSYLAAFAGIHSISIAARVILLFFRAQTGFSLQTAYNLYFYSYWGFAVIEQTLLLMITYQIFYRAMRPFKGLSRLGGLVFKWVCGVAVVITLGSVMFPWSARTGWTEWIFAFTGRAEQGISILTVCLMLFVCFAIGHLGITYRSHIFGSSLGLGVLGSTGLVSTAWYGAHSALSVYAPIYVFAAVSSIVTFAIWGTYFLLPEPKRQMVLLPTTSPYFHWNQISEALGDNPGVVAVAGFTPDSLSAAERLVLGASASVPNPAQRRTKTSIHVRVQSSEPAIANGTQR